MFASMKKIGNPGVILHIGAGRGSDLKQYLTLDPKCIVFVEADLEFAKLLTDSYSNIPQLSVVNKVITSQGGEVSFHKFNLSDYNGIYPPGDKLFELYPGLKEKECVRQRSQKIVDFLESLGSLSDKSNYLIIDTPGEERAIINSIVNSKQIYEFEFVDIFCTREDFFNTGSHLKSISSLMSHACYELIGQASPYNNDRLVLHFNKNSLQIEYLDLKNRYQTKSDENSKYKHKVTQLKDQLDILNIDNEATKIKLENFQKENLIANKKINENNIKLDSLKKEKHDLETQLEKAEKEILILKQQIKELSNKNYDYERKLPLINKEFIKAEAQIELIKDIMISNKAF